MGDLPALGIAAASANWMALTPWIPRAAAPMMADITKDFIVMKLVVVIESVPKSVSCCLDLKVTRKASQDAQRRRLRKTHVEPARYRGRTRSCTISDEIQAAKLPM